MRKKLNKKKSPLLDEIEQRRIVSILFVVALLFIILFVKLYVVMIVDSSKYKKKLDKLSYNTVEVTTNELSGGYTHSSFGLFTLLILSTSIIGISP